MSLRNDDMMTLYGKASRAFVDYEEYTQEECIFYYRILEKVNRNNVLKQSNYLIAGIKSVIEESAPLKALFEQRFSVKYDMAAVDIAKKRGISKQGIMQKFEEAYNFIRSRDRKYDISKRIAWLNQAVSQLQNAQKVHSTLYTSKNLPIETLPLKVHSYKCLKAYGVDTISQFMSLSEKTIRSIEGIGQKTLYDIIQTQKELSDKFSGGVHEVSTIPVDGLGLSSRAVSCIRQLGVKTIEQFKALTKTEVFKAWHVGEKTWEEIYQKQQMLKYGEV